VTDVAIDLGDDGAADTVTVNATGGDDVVRIVNTGGVVTVTGLSATVTIANFDASDRLVVNGLGGDDVINASGFNAALQLTLAGGDGADVLIGGLGADVLLGGAGNDVLNGGGGLDVLDGGTGDNIIQGSAVFAQPGGLASAAAATLVLPAPTSALLASEPSTLAQPHA